MSGRIRESRQWPNRFRGVLALLLGAGLIVLAAGCTLVPTRGQQVWRSLVRYDYPSEPVGSPAFEEALDRYTGSALHHGASALLLQNGDQTYPVMLALIESATERISFETYIVDNDPTTDRFYAALKAAAARSVEVRVIIDAAGFQRSLIANADELVAAGVQARVFNPYFMSWTLMRGNNRDHRKILVADGRYAILGGINISHDQEGDGVSGWRDTSLLVTGGAVADAEQVFAESWEQAGRGILGKNLPLMALNPLKKAVDSLFMGIRDMVGEQSHFTPPPYRESTVVPQPDLPPMHTGSASVRVVASAPDRYNSPTYDLAILAIRGAREKVDAAFAYFVPPFAVRRALLDAAKRGVEVRLLLPGVTDVRFVREIGMRFYGELLRAGVKIYEWPHVILHAKTMAVDGRWLMVGSANMDGRSYFLNYEACLAVTDASLAGVAHTQFEDDLRLSKEMTLDDWLKRGTKQKLIEAFLMPLAGQY